MVKKSVAEPLETEKWIDINAAIEAASREELLEALKKFHKIVKKGS